MMGSRRAALYLVLVFLLGLALGVLGTLWGIRSGWFHWGRRPYDTRSAVEWLSRELTLTPEQQTQLEGILDETAVGYRAIRERVGPEYEQVRQAGREKIRAILTAEQKNRFEELVRKIDEDRAQRRERESRKDKK